MNRRLRTALAVTAALGAGLLMTACGGDDSSSSADSTATPSATATASATTTPAAPAPATTTAPAGGNDDASAEKDKSSGSGGSDDSGKSKSKSKTCVSDDISWSATLQSQAGGYYLVKAVAKSGVTCVLPGGLPVVAFGSDGTEAGPAEQVAGDPITLHSGVAAYAGVNPKSTNTNGGKEFDYFIVSASDADRNPVSLKVGNFTEDKPIVTDWHTNPDDAVPFAN